MDPMRKDPCRHCPGDCGVICHWDDLTVSAPTVGTAKFVECQVHPSCPGYEPRLATCGRCGGRLLESGFGESDLTVARCERCGAIDEVR